MRPNSGDPCGVWGNYLGLNYLELWGRAGIMLIMRTPLVGGPRLHPGLREQKFLKFTLGNFSAITSAARLNLEVTPGN